MNILVHEATVAVNSTRTRAVATHGGTLEETPAASSEQQSGKCQGEADSTDGQRQPNISDFFLGFVGSTFSVNQVAGLFRILLPCGLHPTQKHLR